MLDAKATFHEHGLGSRQMLATSTPDMPLKRQKLPESSHGPSATSTAGRRVRMPRNGSSFKRALSPVAMCVAPQVTAHSRTRLSSESEQSASSIWGSTSVQSAVRRLSSSRSLPASQAKRSSSTSKSSLFRKGGGVEGECAAARGKKKRLRSAAENERRNENVCVKDDADDHRAVVLSRLPRRTSRTAETASSSLLTPTAVPLLLP